MPTTAEGIGGKGKLQQVNFFSFHISIYFEFNFFQIQELKSRLKATDDLKEKAKIHAQLLELPESSIDSPSENVVSFFIFFYIGSSYMKSDFSRTLNKLDSSI